MRDPKTYKWEFERSRWDVNPSANTFSVGIYQWLPKSAGKGLKKSKTLRVTGYTADSQAVYAKASQVCRKLNQSKARYEALPSWAQKQYSVPKPNNLVLHGKSNEFTGQEVRTLRQQLMKRLLLPAGFVQRNASTYVRRVGELVQLINFQTMTWGGSFTVNLGLHYTFTPPVLHRKRIPWTRIDPLDCAIKGRIGFFLPRKLDTWFSFGTDLVELSEKLGYCARQSVAILERYSVILENPSTLLLKPPNIIAPFRISYPTVFLASLEMRFGRYDVAKKRLTQPILPEHRDAYIPRHRQLLRRIPRNATSAGKNDYRPEVMEWLTA